MVRMIQPLAILGILVVITGCNNATTPSASDTPKTTEAKPSSPEEGHSHGEGPNGGPVADWGGGKYHVEFTVNHDTQEATIFVLDSNAKNAAPIKVEKLLLNIKEPVFQVDLMPSPMKGESEGMSSRFVGKDKKLGVVQEFEGTISGEVDGTPYVGDFKEEAHGH